MVEKPLQTKAQRDDKAERSAGVGGIFWKV
jgi:hypothetical protein